MGFWKILAGATIGVGAIAAAPFTGGGSVLAGASLIGSLAGVGTIAAAVGVGAAGAAAGVYLSDVEEEEQENRERKAREVGKEAGEKIAAEKYETMMKELVCRFSAYVDFERKLVGLFAISMAVANAAGVISEEEKADLDQLVSGISSSSLPPHITGLITRLRNTPPSFDLAMSKAKDYGCTTEDIDAVVNIISNSDNIITPEAEVFMYKWNEHNFHFAWQ